MTDNVDEAWNQFKKSSESIAKASVNEKLDTLAAQLNEVQTDTKRLAQIVPKIMGDESAIDQANAGAMDPMAMMGGEMPPMDGGEEGGAPPMGGDEEMMPEGEEGMPPEDELGAEGEEGLPPAEDTIGGEGDVGADVNDEGGGDVFSDEEDEDVPEAGEGLGETPGEFDNDLKGEGDNDAVDVLKDALQEALDNDQMGLVSKIADAIAKLQGSSNGSDNILSGGEEPILGGGAGGEGGEGTITAADLMNGGLSDETEGAEEEQPESEPESESASESDDEPDAEKIGKSAITKSELDAAPEGTTEPLEQVAESGTDEVKAKVMEAVAEGLDEALGTDEEVPAEEESEEDEGEYSEDEGEEEKPEEDKNEEIAENPFEECGGEGTTMKSALKFAESTSFKDLLSFKKMNHCGVDGKPAKDAQMFMKMDNTQGQLDDLVTTPGMNDGEEESDEGVEEIPLEDVESAKEVTDAPDALEVGVRTEELPEGSEDVTDGVVSETDQIDEVGEPINAGGTTDGLDAPVDNSPVEDEDDEEEKLDDITKSATLDEVKKPCQDLKSGKSSKPADMLDDVDEKKSPSGSATPKPTITDDVDEKKGKGTAENPGDLLDDIDAKKGEGSAKNVPDMLDDVGHEKKATEHTVKPGTGLLDDVKTVKKSDDTGNGKHIMSMKELMSVRKSGQRPDAITSTSGDLVRPELGNPIRKTATDSPVRMGHGVDPHKVTEQDWAEYNLYMAQKKL